MRTQEGWFCDLRFEGCGTDALSAWLCAVEQIEVSACRPCREQWQELARNEPALRVRCPRCADRQIREARRKPQDPGPLTGLVANALDEAMRVEGILVDARIRVLRRLARDAAWLNGWGSSSAGAAAPEDAGQRGIVSAPPVEPVLGRGRLPGAGMGAALCP